MSSERHGHRYNGGFVERITDKEVVIREEYKDFKGTVKYKDIAKKLRPSCSRPGVDRPGSGEMGTGIHD